MKLHEYQAKRVMAGFGLPVLPGRVLEAADRVGTVLKKLGDGPWVLKAQVHTGGRGKAGGVKVVADSKEAGAFVKGLLGKPLVTHQTGPQGLVVRKILAEPAVRAVRELYVAVLVNRRTGRPVLIASGEGGMDIEELAVTAPDKIVRVDIDPLRGLEAFQARDVAFAVGLTGDLLAPAVAFLQNLVKMFLATDASLVEVNPLGVIGEGAERRLLAMDAKVTLDDNAAFRHKDLFQEADWTDLSDAEKRAGEVGISYIRLDGNIGCLVNGAGLAMATMDIIKLHGGEPANFLDVGGGATVEQVTEAFQIILSDPKVKAILVNIFGGIMKCDVIAQGVVQAVKNTGLDRPLVVRLEGNRVEEGRQILSASGLAITPAVDLADGAKKAVAAAAGAAS
ncbi:MAG: ADP-forming succinate--CoA ligase subunit beta [Elusimicrobia bacterium]|nr:ADP-forming succinate--CoA ligase subunit beta [Elusimicrobiota bacterium]MBK7545690.1 ADP-forming succinate--CoA ligase subunit beta [Elusimicrobiota bacterium]MBK7574953.1 ADP-forming succinate--CoA ligase subunit beta [Elusimicrobiota bacterium]MBK7687779.1 ADP-forming succinate--CoA ligase subunit beta [Elusimicrobiota bacterium]MBK8125299.1 ADP-forming succinate--CoA ligase subunit beta [Elusimicrobiota bacterium]